MIVLSLSIFRGKSIKKTFLINCLGDSIQGAFDNEMSPAGRHDCGALVISTEKENSHPQNNRDLIVLSLSILEENL